MIKQIAKIFFRGIKHIVEERMRESMNLTIQQNSNKKLAFGEKVPTEKVIKTVINNSFGNYEDVLDVTRAMCKQPNTDITRKYGLREIIKRCSEKLLQKFPQLKEVKANYVKEFAEKNKSEQFAQQWLNNQTKAMGSEELDVPTFNLNYVQVQRAMDEDYMATHSF